MYLLHTSTVGITGIIFGTIVYKFCSFVSEYLCLTKFERGIDNNMLGNITVGIVIVLAVAACGLGVA